MKVRAPVMAALIGARKVLNNEALPGGGVRLLPETSVISMRHDAPEQWLVTVGQTATAGSGVTPWQSSGVDGQTTFSGLFTAPALDPGTKLRMRLRWGAGGTRFTTIVDYPVAGAVFGLVAETFDLDVIVGGSPTTYATLGEVPVVGAFMVPGTATDRVPLQYLDVYASIAAEGGARYWGVKAYAKSCVLRVDQATAKAAVRLRATWLNRAGDPLGYQNLEGEWTYELVVPHGAVLLQVQNLNQTNAASMEPLWLSGLV